MTPTRILVLSSLAMAGGVLLASQWGPSAPGDTARLAMAGLGNCPQPGSARMVVATGAELERAARCAAGETTILLKPGNYGRITLVGAQGLTIRSQDPRTPATFEMLKIARSRDIVLSHARFAGPSEGLRYRLEIMKSDNIVASDLDMPGTPGQFTEASEAAVHIRFGRQIVLRRLNIAWTRHAIGFVTAQGLTIEDNVIRDVRTDGIRGGGASQLLIARNRITSIHPTGDDHPDGIQLWTSNETVPARDIRIVDNLIERGTGKPAQGIFLRDEGEKLPYENVEISNNVVIGSLWNGITVNGGRGVIIRSNTVLPLPDQRTWIRMENLDRAEVSANRAGEFLIQPNIATASNRKGPASETEIRRAIDEWTARVRRHHGSPAQGRQPS